MNRKHTFGLGFILLCYIFLTSCGISSSKITSKSEKKLDTLAHALLWEISGNGLDQPSYLFGTIHLINEKDFFWPTGTLTAIESSKKVAMELNMEEFSNIGSMTTMMSKMYMQGDTSLTDLYTKEEFNYVNEFFMKKGIPLSFLGRIQPLFLSALVGIDTNQEALEATESYELKIQKIANSSLKPIVGLETIEDQLNAIEAIPYKAQSQILIESIKTIDLESDSADDLIQLYTNQNINGMLQTTSDDGIFAQYEDVLLKNRNTNWIEKIQTLIKKESTFIAVGAGHLGGDHGVIRLLARKGYTLKAIRNK